MYKMTKIKTINKMKKLILIVFLMPFFASAQKDLGCEEAIAFALNDELNISDSGNTFTDLSSFLNSENFRNDFNNYYQSSSSGTEAGFNFTKALTSLGASMDTNNDNFISNEEQRQYYNYLKSQKNEIKQREWYRTEGRKTISHRPEAIKAWIECKKLQTEQVGIRENFETVNENVITLELSFYPTHGVNSIVVKNVFTVGLDYNKSILKDGLIITTEKQKFTFFRKPNQEYVTIDIYTDVGGSIQYFNDFKTVENKKESGKIKWWKGSYEGELINNVPNGFGTYFFYDEKFIGEFVDGDIVTGKYYDRKGMLRYEGEFGRHPSFNLPTMNGKGTYYNHSRNRRTTGEWKHERAHNTLHYENEVLFAKTINGKPKRVD